MKSPKSLVEEVESRLIEAARGVSAAHAQAKRIYHGSEHPHLGLTAPMQRQAFELGYSFSHLPPKEQLVVWEAVWLTGRYHETKEQALFYISSVRDAKALAAMWPSLARWAKKSRCWPSSDGFCSAFARIMEHDPGRVYPTLCRWNKSRNPWERRRSIVSLLYYSQSRRRFPTAEQILSLVEPLIEDEDRFVQKGIGWTLREAWQVYPNESYRFIRKHADRLSAIAFAEATRKLPGAQRTPIVAARRRRSR